MKRVVLIALASLMLGVPAAQAQQGKPAKTYEGTYNVTAGGACGVSSCVYYYDCKNAKSGCALVRFDRPMRKVRLQVVDETGLPVLARVYILGGYGPVATACNDPEDPFLVNAGGAMELLVHVVAGACEDNSPSAPTRGVVRATPV